MKASRYTRRWKGPASEQWIELAVHVVIPEGRGQHQQEEWADLEVQHGRGWCGSVVKPSKKFFKKTFCTR